MVSKTRVVSSATMKTKTKGSLLHHPSEGEQPPATNVLLARGLSARYCGANIPFTILTADEMERDLRHMEAFSNACIAYSQQYYIYQNSGAAAADGHNHASGGGGSSSSSSKRLNAAHAAAAANAQPPMIAMPVRIDPEEEKRLATLRAKIQLCEGQREILESQYLSLRAHYVHMSQRLKNHRQTVNGRIALLQDLVQKRGQLVALQRARLQISREALACLHYRQSGGKPVIVDEKEENGHGKEPDDLVEIWNQIDEQFKQAEEACRSDPPGGIEPWQALKVAKNPPRGVPVLLSTLAKPLGFAAAWSTAGMFGSKPDSMCWLEPEFPEPDHRTKSLPAMREEVAFLRRELEKEQHCNRDLQAGIISRRKANIELVAMMALLRTETEAVVARHNILLESDVAKDAAIRIQLQEDEAILPTGGSGGGRHDDDDDDDEEDEDAPSEGQVEDDGDDEQEDAAPTTEAKASPLTTKTATATTTPAPAVVEPALEVAVAAAPATEGGAVGSSTGNNAISTTATQEYENDGDDEGEPGGEEEEEDEGEILEGDAAVAAAAAPPAGAPGAAGAEKRTLEETAGVVGGGGGGGGGGDEATSDGVDGSQRNKRRKV